MFEPLIACVAMAGRDRRHHGLGERLRYRARQSGICLLLPLLSLKHLPRERAQNLELHRGPRHRRQIPQRKDQSSPALSPYSVPASLIR